MLSLQCQICNLNVNVQTNCYSFVKLFSIIRVITCIDTTQVNILKDIDWSVFVQINIIDQLMADGVVCTVYFFNFDLELHLGRG